MKKKYTHTNAAIVKGAMDEHARRIAVAFGEWTSRHCTFSYLIKGCLINAASDDTYYTTEELFDYFTENVLTKKTIKQTT